MNIHKNKQRGAMSTGAIVAVVVVILLIIGLAYWYSTSNPNGANTDTASTTTDGTGATGTNGNSTGFSVTDNPTKTAKTYTNFRYMYALDFPGDAQNNIANPDSITLSYDNGTTTADATLKISTGLDVSHIGFCLTVPQGATGVATTTLGGNKFLSYVVGASTKADSGTTYFRTLRTSPAGNTCYDIQKNSQASTTINTKFNTILQTFNFVAF